MAKVFPWGDDTAQTPRTGGPANPGYNPWNSRTHRLGYTENVEDYDDWEARHRNDDGLEDETETWVKPHNRKPKKRRK